MERITSNIEKVIVAKAHEEDHKDRNTGGRVFYPDGTAFRVLVEDVASGEMVVMATGVTRADEPGLYGGVFIRSRNEANVERPPLPPKPEPEEP